MSWLLALDGTLFHWINRGLANPLFDRIMPWITDLGEGGAVWLLVLFLLAVLGKGTGRKMAFLGTVALVISWQLSDSVLKPLLARPRPFLHFSDVRLLVAAPSQYSFPSGHTSTSFGPAVALFRKNRKWGIWALLLAVVIGFSRVYVGVHYPLDVLGGVCLGSVVGWLAVSFESSLDKLVIAVKGIIASVKGRKPGSD